MDQGNRFNAIAAQTSFLENMEMVSEIEAAFNKQRRSARQGDALAHDGPGNGSADGLAADGEGQEGEAEPRSKKPRTQASYWSCYWDFVCANFPDRFGSFREYDAAKRFTHRMQQAELWDLYREYVNQHCEFTNKKLTNKDTYLASDEVAKSLMKNEEYYPVALEALKFTLPTTDGTPWLITGDAQAKTRMARLHVAMEESQVFKCSMKGNNPKLLLSSLNLWKAKKRREQSGDKPQRKAKAKPAKKKKKAAQQPGLAEQSMEPQVLDSSDGKLRATTLLDDFVNAVNVTIEPVESPDETAVRAVIHWFLEFVFEKQVSVPAKVSANMLQETAERH